MKTLKLSFKTTLSVLVFSIPSIGNACTGTIYACLQEYNDYEDEAEENCPG